MIFNKPQSEPKLYYKKLPFELIEKLNKNVKKANKRLKKAEISSFFELTYSDPYFTSVNSSLNNFNKIKVVDVFINEAVISYKGWTIHSLLEKTFNGTISKTLNNDKVLEETPTSIYCDHCGIKRKRNKTYLLINNSGNTVQVGSTCLQDFIGVKPKGLWALETNFLNNIFENFSDTNYYPVNEVLSKALKFSSNGSNWISRSDAEYFCKTSTSDLILDSLIKDKNKNINYVIDNKKFLNELFSEIINSDPNNDYIRNLQTICNEGYVSEKHLAIVASSVSMLERKRRKAAKDLINKNYKSGFITKIKEKVSDLKVAVTVVFHRENAYGDSTLLIMQTSEGHLIKWSASKWIDVNVGDVLMIKGTVKDHSVYNGQDQTVLTRCKIEKLTQE